MRLNDRTICNFKEINIAVTFIRNNGKNNGRKNSKVIITTSDNLKKLEAERERDPNLEKAFLEDKTKFLKDHGFNEKNVI